MIIFLPILLLLASAALNTEALPIRDSLDPEQVEETEYSQGVEVIDLTGARTGDKDRSAVGKLFERRGVRAGDAEKVDSSPICPRCGVAHTPEEPCSVQKCPKCGMTHAKGQCPMAAESWESSKGNNKEDE